MPASEGLTSEIGNKNDPARGQSEAHILVSISRVSFDVLAMDGRGSPSN